MPDQERTRPTGPLFHDPLPTEHRKVQTSADSGRPRVTSGAVPLLLPPAPPASRLIVGRPVHKRMVMDLQKKFSNQLGFLPGVAIDFYLENQLTGIAVENGVPCGYVLGRASFRYNRLMRPITQAAVFMDAQRRQHGLSLVEAVCRHAVAAGQQAVQARCAADIDAVEFWAAAGFVEIGRDVVDNARGREIVTFRRLLVTTLPDWFLTPPPYAGHKAKKR